MELPKLILTFPEEAAAKFEDFVSTKGEAKWNVILQNFENVLGFTPKTIETQNIRGTVNLPTRVHAGIK